LAVFLVLLDLSGKVKLQLWHGERFFFSGFVCKSCLITMEKNVFHGNFVICTVILVDLSSFRLH